MSKWAVGSEDKVVVRSQLDLTENLYKAYEQQAKARGITPERLMAERLAKCVDRTEKHTVNFTDEQKVRLDRALGHTVSDAEGVLLRLLNNCRLSVDKLEIEIPPRVLNRIKTRVFRGETLDGVVKREVILGLERFVGLKF